jgi:competence protein ComEC
MMNFVQKRPLAGFVLCMALGMAAAFLGLHWAVGAALLGSGLLLVLIKNGRYGALLMAAGLGMILVCLALIRPPLPADGEYKLSARVASRPIVEENRVRMTLDAVQLDGQPAGVKVQAYFSNYDGRTSFLKYGQHIETTAQIFLPKGQTNPHGSDFAAHLWNQGIGLCASSALERVQVTKDAGFTLVGASIEMSERLKGQIRRLFPRESALFAAMLLGDQRDLDEAFKRDFRAAGIAHLLAVSGLHVGYIAWMVNQMLLWLGLSRKNSFRLMPFFLVGYVFLTGCAPSAIRAALMYLILFGEWRQGRSSDSLTGLAAAFILLAFLNPLGVRQAGFVLSFSAVAGILLLNRPLRALLYRIRGKNGASKRPNRVLTPVLNSISVSAAAQLGVMPASIQFFHRLPLWSVLANLLAAPLMALAFPLGILALGLSFVSMEAGRVLGFAADMLLHMMNLGAGWIASWPGALLRLPDWPIYLLALYALLMIAASEYVHRPRWVGLTCLALLPVMALAGWGISQMQPREALLVSFLDVGQGDCTMVDARGALYLIDTGSENSGAEDVLTAMARPLEAVFLTHPHEDHAGNLAEVGYAAPTKKIYLPECWARTPDSERMAGQLADLERQGVEICTLKAGDEIRLSEDTCAKVLFPPEDYVPKSGNEGSMVLLLDSGERARLLITGDQLSKTMETLEDVQAQVLKVNHHGGLDGTSGEMLRRINPALSVISVGYNRYGHPKERVLKLLNRAPSKVMRTDQSGAVMVRQNALGNLEAAGWLDREE